MALNNIKFSACQNTMRGFKKRTGHFPTLTDGVDKTPAGVVRIGEYLNDIFWISRFDIEC
jgi:intracellular sulfur oxidation DsrE/DsrF family protein